MGFWFRVLLLARIDMALKKDNYVEWGFIDCPGIGFKVSHPPEKGKRI